MSTPSISKNNNFTLPLIAEYLEPAAMGILLTFVMTNYGVWLRPLTRGLLEL